MNLETETWEIINSYFRDTPNYLVRHHIDSYNDFIHNKIPQIMKNFQRIPPYVLIDKEDRNVIYEVKVYYGGKTHDRYKITRPTIINYPSGESRQLFPNEARLKNVTYGFDFFFDVDIEYTMKKNDVPILEGAASAYSDSLRDIYLGKIPIMLRSDLCILSTATGELLTQMGEDKYDLGGYFILDGAEKVIVSQERKAENIVFLTSIPQTSGNEKYTHKAEVKCVSDEAFANARTVQVQLESRGGAITVRLGQERPLLQENQRRDVPLFIMFRALGIETDKEILEYIIGSLEGELAEKMMDLLRPSILDPFIISDEIYDKERAETYLVKLPTRSQQSDRKDVVASFSEVLKSKTTLLSYLYNTFNEALFPHITSTTGDINKAKAYYLGYVTRRLLLLRLGLVKDTERDNFMNKRIDLSGFLLSTLFRDAFEQVIRNARVETNRFYNNNSKEFSGEDRITSLVNDTNIFQIFDRDVFKKYFNGALKIGTIGQKVGVVQAMDRITRNLTIAHLRRIIDNVAGGRVTVQRRRLHASQYGCVCPVDTPEGQKVGLNKGLALLSHITFGTPARNIINGFLLQEGIEVLDDLTPYEVQILTKVFVNGNWVGCHRDPESLIKLFKLYRRNGLINIFISISWERSNNEIYIFTDGGRFVRPLYIIEDNNHLLQPRHIREIVAKGLTFTDLVSGFRKRAEEYNYYDSDVKPLALLGLARGDALYKDKLAETQAVIEYIDCQEFDTTLLTIGYDIPHTTLQRFTHTELHPSMYLSFNAHLIPFGEHKAAARTIYASKHVKQGISTYALNFNSRIDTSAQLLNYPQRPLIQSRLQNVITQDKFGQGINIFVAIAKYNYTQDDAIVGNRSSVDMGLFHTSHYKQYSDMEMRDPKTGEENRFYNPLYKDELAQYPVDLIPKKGLNYGKIDKWGLPKKGEVIEKDDVVICKYVKTKDEIGLDRNADMSTTTKLGTEGSVVDAVYTWQTNPEGDRAVKVRTCKNKPPVMGDKFASRCAQKGTFGITLQRQDMPYTEDGIIIDFILDPSGIPSRMTVSQLIEIMFGNLAAEMGFYTSFNPFEVVDVEQINHVMEDMLGFSTYGDRVLYNGYTGEQMDVRIFSGCIYYQRLKYIVDDKINTRLSGFRDPNGIPHPGGLYTIKERQSVAGRANGGGLKFGEMERDALIAHGIWGFIKESYIERCDKFIIQVSAKTGAIAIANPEAGIYYDNEADGVVSYHLLEGVGSKGVTPDRIIGLNLFTQKSTDFINLVVPYTFKLLVQEMEGMMIQVRFDVSRLRKVLPDILGGGKDSVGELTTEMIDDMMDDTPEDNDVLEDDYDYMEDMEQEQDGGGDSTQDSESEIEETEEEQNGTANTNPNEKTDQEEDNAHLTDESKSSDADILHPQLTAPMNPQLTAPMQPQLTQPQLTAPIQPQNLVQPQMQQTQFQQAQSQLGGAPGAIAVNHLEGGSEEPDLSAYGGVKPEFDVIEREDDKAIENLNAQLLGIQTGGQNERLEQAKTAGIASVLDSYPRPTAESLQAPMQPIQSMQPMQPGLNFSFNNQQAQPSQNMNSSIPNISNNGMGSNMMGGAPQKQVSFNNDIKVIELDTKISEGFLYSGSKNLDPFGQ